MPDCLERMKLERTYIYFTMKQKSLKSEISRILLYLLKTDIFESFYKICFSKSKILTIS